MPAPSNGGHATSDPFRTTYSNSGRANGANGANGAFDAGQQPSGGLLGRCKPCTNMCKSAAKNGEMVIPGGAQRYPGVDDAAEDADGDGYLLLEEDFSDDEKDVGTFVAELKDMKDTVKGLWKILVLAFVLVAGLASCLASLYYSSLSPEDQYTAKVRAILGSIPIVALLFTWFHIWLAIQMMFLPMKFFGLYEFRGSGMGIGWQGIVPRKAHKMAQTAYISGRPYLDGPRDWMSRVDASVMVGQFRPQLRNIVKDSLTKVTCKHFPASSSLLGSVHDNVATAAVDKIQATSNDLWNHWIDLLCDPTIGVDNDGLIVKVFTENKELLNQFFLKLGAREFRFIEHCGAAMGFVCGVVQLIAFNNLTPTGRAIFLPLSGFCLGIVSNWAAIMCVFKPCFPVPIKICGCHICNIQGLFLKRQPDVAVLYSKLLCEHFLSFPKIVNYLQSKPALWAKLKESYLEHNARVLKETLGMSANFLAPLALGQDQFQAMEEELKIALVKGLAKCTEIHKIGGKYIGKVTNIEKNNARVLKTMPPDKFEDLLHPVFKEDEWILILLGGVLGAIVGTAQVFFLRF